MFYPFLPPLNDQGNATYKYYTSCISLSASCVICAMYNVHWCWMNKHHTIPYHTPLCHFGGDTKSLHYLVSMPGEVKMCDQSPVSWTPWMFFLVNNVYTMLITNSEVKVSLTLVCSSCHSIIPFDIFHILPPLSSSVHLLPAWLLHLPSLLPNSLTHINRTLTYPTTVPCNVNAYCTCRKPFVEMSIILCFARQCWPACLHRCGICCRWSPNSTTVQHCHLPLPRSDLLRTDSSLLCIYIGDFNRIKPPKRRD